MSTQKKLSERENEVIKEIDAHNKIAERALRKVFSHFEDEDSKNGTCHITILRAVYVDRSIENGEVAASAAFDTVWKLANFCHVSDRTVFRYRNMYLDWFDYYYRKFKKENVNPEEANQEEESDPEE